MVIAKTGGKEISELGLKEIAQYAASYSKLWKYGFYEGECYCVVGEQVSKTPPSGEYIKKGSFMVRGKRKYFKAALGLCIGIEKPFFQKESFTKETIYNINSNQKESVAEERSYNEKHRLVACPCSQKDKLDIFVELEPGDDTDKNALSKEIMRFFVDRAENKEEVKQIVMQEKILSLLPPGKSKIKGFS